MSKGFSLISRARRRRRRIADGSRPVESTQLTEVANR